MREPGPDAADAVPRPGPSSTMDPSSTMGADRTPGSDRAQEAM